MDTCPDCQEDFYSERAFNEHKTFEWLKRTVSALEVSLIMDELRISNVLSIMHRDHISAEQAAKKHWALHSIINKVYQEMRDGEVGHE